MGTIDTTGHNNDYIAFLSYEFAAIMSAECKRAQAMLSIELCRTFHTHVEWVLYEVIIEYANEKAPSIRFYCIFDIYEKYYVEGKDSKHLHEEEVNMIDALKAIKGTINLVQRGSTSNEELDSLIKAAVILAKRK